MKPTLSSLLKVIVAAFREFHEDNGTFLASGLAFGLLFYSVPFSLLTVSALSYTVVKSDTALVWIRRIALNLLSHSHDVFDSFVTGIYDNREDGRVRDCHPAIRQNRRSQQNLLYKR